MGIRSTIVYPDTGIDCVVWNMVLAVHLCMEENIMAIEQKIIGANVFFIDRENNLLFTKGELTVARQRYQKEAVKLQAKGGA